MKENHLFPKFVILFIFLFLFFTPSFALIPGDFGSEGGGPPDGVVDFEDLMIFAMAYGSTPGDANWNVLCDIAGQGSTTPDGVVDFEDLMVFAMHYGEFLVHNLTKDTYYNTIQAALDDADSLEGIYISAGFIIIDNCIISNNTAIDGGGIYNWGGTSTITSSTISGNTAVNKGGGIWNYSSGTLTITSSSTISANNVSQQGQGGGIYLEGTGTITIGGSSLTDTDNFNTFTDNKKDGIVSAYQHIRDSSGDCRSSYPYNYYNPN